MKTLLLIVILLAISTSLNATDKKDIKVPSKVKEAFVKTHPEANDVKWEFEDNGYEASFKVNGKETSVLLDRSGNIKQTGTLINVSELPNGAEKYISAKYKGYKIEDATKIIDSKGNMTFEVAINKGKVNKDVFFDKDGKYIKSKNEKYEVEGKEDDD
jgi:hypothetical protein